MNNSIISNYESFYCNKDHSKVYPTEFVVRTFLADYPQLKFKKPDPKSRILDIGFGDGRNTAFLCELGLDVHGVEISPEIVKSTSDRHYNLGFTPNLLVGMNNSIPFTENYFDYILSSFCIYYCPEGSTLDSNLKEYLRVLKNTGFLIANFADVNSYIFDNAEEIKDGTFIIRKDPYGNRVGSRLAAFYSKDDLVNFLGSYLTDISVRHASNNYYGRDEKSFWITGKVK